MQHNMRHVLRRFLRDRLRVQLHRRLFRLVRFRLFQYGTGGFSMIDENRSRTALTATINTTEDCNLRCRYCYETNKKPRVMRFETAARFLELLLEEDDPVLDESEGSLYGVERGITLDFIGGDALSNPKLLDAILSFWVQALFRSRSYTTRDSGGTTGAFPSQRTARCFPGRKCARFAKYGAPCFPSAFRSTGARKSTTRTACFRTDRRPCRKS